MTLTIGYLYHDLMNIYGDTGNVITLKKRAEWRGIKVTVKNISTKDILKEGEVDLFFFGGGQDQSQEVVGKDLLGSTKGQILKKEIERGIPLLTICGGYQLLGEYYQPHNSEKIPGLGIFSAYTVAGSSRMIGNIVVKLDNQLLGSIPSITHQLVGFENHSGKTYLKTGTKPLGKVIKGFGNNGEDQTEGCIYKNAIGCYMHGSLLPKNPSLADWLLSKALEVKENEPSFSLTSLDDSIENQAHQVIISRFS